MVVVWKAKANDDLLLPDQKESQQLMNAGILLSTRKSEECLFKRMFVLQQDYNLKTNR